MARGRYRGALPGWLARRRYGPHVKRRLAAGPRAAPEAVQACADPAGLRTILADPDSNVIPLRRGAAPRAERR